MMVSHALTASSEDLTTRVEAEAVNDESQVVIGTHNLTKRLGNRMLQTHHVACQCTWH